MIFRYYAERGGWRFVVLFHKGYKHVRLFDTGTFDVYRITPRDIERLKPYEDIAPKTLASRIRKRRQLFTRCGVGFPKKTVEKVLSALRGAS
ncbi:MAG: hypothetical protein AAFY26_20475 [Cyanobacteria bacterium J06638_22]